MDKDLKKQIVDKIREAQNILITVSNDPSIDQLAAAIGLTLVVNKLGKHGTAVFSGKIPSTIEFLRPEETLEQTTDSLRDFIISLDRSKADKLRYKVEDDVVKIFITPYHTRISEDDLSFEHGDFNVDVVIALGVDQREHLDQAIVAHGRILHDATVISLSAGITTSDVGSLNWQDPRASSLSEMLVGVSEKLKQDVLDEQIATAYLTGIVAETERFSNEKTSPDAMSVSAKLMAAGANQQLISTTLQAAVGSVSTADQPEAPATQPIETASPTDTSVLTVAHDDAMPSEEAVLPQFVKEAQPSLPEPQKPVDDIHIDELGTFTAPASDEPDEIAKAVESIQLKGRTDSMNRGKTIQPPTHDGVEPLPTLPSDKPFSPYLEEPVAASPEMNSAQYNDELPVIDPLAPVSDPTQSPLISVQDDAESFPSKDVPTTEHVQLTDDGVTDVTKPTEPELPELPSQLGPEVETTDTLDKIEDAVQDYTGVDPHTSPAIPAVSPVPATVPASAPVFPGVELTEPPLEAEPEPAPPVPGAVNPDTGLDQDAARRAVEAAMAASSAGYDPNRPEPLQSVGSQPLDLPSTEQPNTPPAPAVPPPIVPPFPLPPTQQ